ncbi:tetratricopeptide repeat protein [Spirosoma sordidisoli]|uniref:Tetratricopeptide repeat protein n=1 Tax=Spirosoma sordidisoli TaxID=2502893 RepID=A0A4Q2UGS7_9BACT|nr:tetratricopeptide repeat protein [Spirosoma sordidisoli]
MITRFCLICTFLCVTCLTGRAQSRLQTADSLYTSGQFLAARVAYERAIFMSSDPGEQFTAALGKVQCLKQQGLYAASVPFLNSQLQLLYPDSLLYRLRYEQILCAYLAGQFENTLSLLDRLPYLHPTVRATPLLLAIRILALNELQRWQEAQLHFRELLSALPDSATTRQDPYQHLPQLKNAKKAQWLATFIPGAGQLYAGKPGEAALSILVQSAGLYFGLTSFLQGYYLSAWGIGAGLFGSFQAGGVRRTDVLIREVNTRRANAFNTQVRQQILTLVR